MDSILVSSHLLLKDRRDDFGFRNPLYTKEVDLLKERKQKQLTTIGDISLVVASGATPLGSVYFNEGINFLRVQNITDEGLVFDDHLHVSKEFAKIVKRSKIENGDILMTIVGATIGKNCVVENVDEEWVTNQAIARIKLKKEINPYYVSAFFKSRFGLAQIMMIKRPIAQGNLNYPELKSVIIPLLDRKEQDRIAFLIQSAYFLRNQKLYQAEEELGKINDYVLKELGINLSKIEGKKSFVIKASKLVKRDDYSYYNGTFDSIREILNSLKCNIKELGEIIDSITSGLRPKGGVSNIEKGIISLGGLHISDKGEIIYEGKEKYISYEFHKLNIDSSIKPNDILIVKDGATTGKVAIVLNDFPLKDCNINEHLFRIRVGKECLPAYLFSYLFSDIGQAQIQHFKSGATVTGITREAISSILVPLPSLEIQKKIVNDTNLCRKNSKDMRIQAENLLNKAKGVIEKLIINEPLTEQEKQFCENLIKEAKQLGFKE